MQFSDCEIGIIGGSGLYSLDTLTIIGEIRPETPWGLPSDALVIAKTVDNVKVAFLARHGRGHYLNPSEVPSRANIAALKSVGCKVIIAMSAVGSLCEEIKPRDFVVPSQIIDRTKGIREHTYFENGVVGHVMFGEPFSKELAIIIDQVQKDVSGPNFHFGKTLLCMEGPQFSTKAESHMYRSFGADIINMSVLPEAKLAREAELPYQMICMATDYDCWRETEEDVSVEAVMETMKDNSSYARKLLTALIPVLAKKLSDGTLKAHKQLKNSSLYSIMTAPEKRNSETVEKLKFILPSIQ